VTRYRFDQLHLWAAKVKARQEYVLQQSARDVFDVAQTPESQGGRMPVVTGRLRESFEARKGPVTLKGAEAYKAAAATMQPGDSLTGVWTVPYALAANFGQGKRAGQFFREIAASKWTLIVLRNAAEAKAKIR